MISFRYLFDNIWTYCLIWRFRSSCPNGLYEKGVLKNLVKITGNHLCRVSFSIKLLAGSLQLHQNESPVQVVSYEFLKRRPFSQTSGNSYLWRIRLFAGVSFRDALGFHHKRTENFFTIKKLRHIFPLQFLNVWINYFLIIPQENEKLSKVHDKKGIRTASINYVVVSS